MAGPSGLLINTDYYGFKVVHNNCESIAFTQNNWGPENYSKTCQSDQILTNRLSQLD